MNTSIHHYLSDYFTVEAYYLAYAEAIFLVPGNDIPTNDVNELILCPSITNHDIQENHNHLLFASYDAVIVMRLVATVYLAIHLNLTEGERIMFLNV